MSDGFEDFYAPFESFRKPDHAGAVERLEVVAHLLVYPTDRFNGVQPIRGSVQTVDLVSRADAEAALSASEAREHALLGCVNAVSSAIGTVRFMDPPDGGCTSLAEQVQRMREELEASEARLRVAVEALGRITTGPGSIAGARDIACQTLATIEGKGS